MDKVRKLRIYAMLMRLQEIEEEARMKKIVVVGIGNPAPESKVLKFEMMAEMPTPYFPQYDELPQKQKHRKKRNYHN